ncbi:MAG TPA: type II toxin-antitoxin system HicA family toxin [Candidatus Micrarchaeaceae archaeon]|nr:type II toxin-antitoxin system HicA family toxin [Candidatus Micrarchaeaceae archaeon]
MRTRELRRILRQHGCDELRQSGSHLIVRCGDCQSVVPIHSEDIPVGTLRSIERDLAPCLGEKWLR